MDLDVLAALSHRDRYERYSRFVKQSSLGPETWNIFLAMGEWFKQNRKVDVVKWDKFGAWFSLVRAAKMPKDKMKVHRDFINILAQKSYDDPDLSPLIYGLAKRDFAGQIGDLALRIADGEKGDFSQIETLIAKHDSLIGKIDRLEDSVTPFSLDMLEEADAPGLEWRLKALREGAGDLRTGDLVIVGKRPDAGGTTLVAGEATHMAEQMVDNDKVVLWVNNEERRSKVQFKLIQATLGWTTEKVLADKEAAIKAYWERMDSKERIVLASLDKSHVKDVDTLAERYDVGLIVIDQIWKMQGFENEGSEVSRQTLIAQWARETAKAVAPVIGVMQAGGEAEGKRWIPQSMLYGSKTGVPGEADLIITLGRDFSTGNMRYLWLPKNKMLTPGDNKMRNGQWRLLLQGDIARFKEV